MYILALRTDNPEAELKLIANGQHLAAIKWPSQGILADTINSKIEKLLSKSSISIKGIEGIVCFKGPGSFTGLRIGLSVGNALAYSQNIPIVATKGENWLEQGIKKLESGQNQTIATPFYDRPAATTPQKK